MFPQQMLHVDANRETFRITMFLQPRDISSAAGTFMDPAVLHVQYVAPFSAMKDVNMYFVP